AAMLSHQNSIIEVAGSFAIDGDDGQIAKITSLCHDLRIEISCGAGLFEHIFRKDMRQVMLTDNDLDIDTKVIFMPQNLNDAATCCTRGRSPFRDLDIDNQAFEVTICLPLGFFAQDAMCSALC